MSNNFIDRFLQESISYWKQRRIQEKEQGEVILAAEFYEKIKVTR